jgi:hypothetical protein
MRINPVNGLVVALLMSLPLAARGVAASLSPTTLPTCADCRGDAPRAPRSGDRAPRTGAPPELAPGSAEQSLQNGDDAHSDEADDAIFYYGH